MAALAPERLYLGDNGRLTCGAQRCAGATAFYSGRDLSGQRMHALTAAEIAELTRMLDGRQPTCEGCGKGAS